MNQQTIEKLQQLKLNGFIQIIDELETLTNQPLTVDDILTLMVERECLIRQNKRLKRLMKNAKLRYPNACVENIHFQAKRELNQQQLRQLMQPQWIENARNIVFIGPTGVGKSYLACAFGQMACRHQYSVLYTRVARLLDKMRMARLDGSYQTLLNKIAKTHVLILDDWGLDQLEREARHDLLELLEDRVSNVATIITTQLPPDKWHAYIGDDTLADAICDRVLHSAYNIQIKGESMRKHIDSIDSC